MSKIEKTFVVAVPRERAWQLFADSRERSQWEARVYEIDPHVGGRVHWEIGQYTSDGEVLEADEPRRLSHRESGHGDSIVTVTLEAVDGGTRVHITQAGFGDGDWEDDLNSTSLGWDQAIRDLLLYVATGVRPERFTQPFPFPGVHFEETPAGLRITQVPPGSFGDDVGLEPGDYLLRLGGIAVFTRGDYWTLLRVHNPTAKLEVDYIRDGELRQGVGVLI